MVLTKPRVVVVGRTQARGSVRLGDGHLARAWLEMGHHVTWVNPPRRWGRGASDGTATPGLDVVTPRVPPGAGLPLVATVVDEIVARAVRGRGPCDVLLVADPRRAGVGPRVEGATTVYWCRDRFTEGNPRHEASAARERRYLPEYDVVTGVSLRVVESLGEVVPDAVVVRNGCDADHFATTPSPDRAEPPTIGFLGGVGWRVDLGLLIGVAEQRPDWRVLVIGEAPPGTLPALPNLDHLGRVPFLDVPGALASVHVGLVPYLDNAFNRASFPLKVFEYLAAGRPVVSSPIDALQDMQPYVRIASGVEATVDAITHALQGPPTERQCRELGAANSWRARASTVLELAGYSC